MQLLYFSTSTILHNCHLSSCIDGGDIRWSTWGALHFLHISISCISCVIGFISANTWVVMVRSYFYIHANLQFSNCIHEKLVNFGKAVKIDKLWERYICLIFWITVSLVDGLSITFQWVAITNLFSSSYKKNSTKLKSI